jgi:hypothetical protein
MTRSGRSSYCGARTSAWNVNRRKSEKRPYLALKGFLGSEMGGRAEVSYEEVAQTLGLSNAAVTTNIHRLRQRHRQLVREEVQATVLEATDVDAELHALCEALLQAEGRVRTTDA